MKYVKLLGLVAMAALAVMAFIGTGTSSALIATFASSADPAAFASSAAETTIAIAIAMLVGLTVSSIRSRQLMRHLKLFTSADETPDDLNQKGIPRVVPNPNFVFA
jgi:hypothetical protein